MSRRPRSRGYILAVGLIAVLTSVKLLAGDGLGRDAPFFLYPVALIAVGWFGSARAALFATLLGVLAGWHFFLRPHGTGLNSLVPLGALAVEGILITAFVVRLRKAHRAAESAGQQLARLQVLTAALAAARTPDEIARIIVEQGATTLNAVIATVSRPVSETELEIIAHQGMQEEDLQRFRRHSIAAALPSSVAFRTGKPQFVESPRELAGRFSDVPVFAKPPRAAVAALPLAAHGRVTGVIGFRFAEPRSFSPQERTLLETFAGQAAQAFERAELYSQEVALRRRLEDLEVLTERLSEAMTREQVAEVVVDHGMQTAGADTCTLYTLDETGRVLELIAHRGIAPEIIERVAKLRPDENPHVRATLNDSTPMWAENDEEYAGYYPELQQMRVEGPRARAFWNVPLTAEGRTFGMLAMGYYEPRRFAETERTFVATFTRHCAEALRRAERLEAEGRARLTAERLQASLATTLRSIGDAVIATNTEGEVTLMNAVAESLTGVSESNARGKPLGDSFQIVNQFTRENVANPIGRVLREGIIVGLGNPTLLISKDGREIPIDDSGAPIRAADGSVTGVVLVFRDTSRKQREATRREFLANVSSVLAESLDYEATLAQLARLVVPTLADWCAVDILEAGDRRPKRLAAFHVDPEKVKLAQELGHKYPPDPDAANGVPRVLRTGRSELHSEITELMLERAAADAEHLGMIRKLGIVSAMLVPLVARGHVLGVLTFVSAESGRRYEAEDLEFAEDLARRCAAAVDNARLYAAEQRARKAADVANRAKDEFLATVSHELRTPLNAILGWAKMMSAAQLDDEKRARAIATIERNSVAMAQLIEDLLDVSRIISGKMRLEVQSVDVARIVEAAIESVRPAADAKSIQLSSALPAGAEPLLADPPRLQQIIWNLLSNAVKFTPNGGKVDVTVSRQHATTEIRVTDSGRGITPQFLPQVFEPFTQESASQSRTRGGLGLGLAITRQLVELHGGRIEAQSEGRDQGATFVVSLPLVQAQRDSKPDAERTARRIRPEGTFERPSQLKGLRVLVVDDDEDARQLVRAVLEECGCHVTAVDNVDAALDAIGTAKNDVLISDIGMPGQDGYDLIRRVRALPAASGGNIAAAALTAYARAEDRQRVLDAGYSRHIAKPVEPAELITVVDSLARALAENEPVLRNLA